MNLLGADFVPDAHFARDDVGRSEVILLRRSDLQLGYFEPFAVGVHGQTDDRKSADGKADDDVAAPNVD